MCNRTSFDILLDFGSLAGEFLLDWSDIDTLQMNQEELVSAGADYIVPSVDALSALFR